MRAKVKVPALVATGADDVRIARLLGRTIGRQHTPHKVAHDDRLCAAPLLRPQQLLRLDRRRLQSSCRSLRRCAARTRTRLLGARPLDLDGFQRLVKPLDQRLPSVLTIDAELGCDGST
eukprot:7380230-Prymnesium_polylepis.4